MTTHFKASPVWAGFFLVKSKAFVTQPRYKRIAKFEILLNLATLIPLRPGNARKEPKIGSDFSDFSLVKLRFPQACYATHI